MQTTGLPKFLRMMVPIVIACSLLVIAIASGKHGRRGRYSLASLRRSILGRRRKYVLEALGLPRTAMVRGEVRSAATPYLQADTWYYPLHAAEKSAIAVTFDHDVVRDVEFFCSGLLDPV